MPSSEQVIINAHVRVSCHIGGTEIIPCNDIEKKIPWIRYISKLAFPICDITEFATLIYLERRMNANVKQGNKKIREKYL